VLFPARPTGSEKLVDELAADSRPFRGLFSSSEEFARRKKSEIDLESREG
jgi:hypothetical protein